MTKLVDFIEKRRKELSESLAPLMEQRAEIDRKISNIHRELNDLNSAGDAIGVPKETIELPLNVIRREAPQITIKQAVLKILEHYPKGLHALDILDKVNQRFDLGIVRTSLSPQLTRLKRDDEKIVNDGPIWRLAHQKKEGPAE
jgi:predicted  nucleic acid-binding Zn-ribbon protein